MESIQTLLIVDDNPADVRFIEEAFQQSGIDPDIHSVAASSEAMDFLGNHRPYRDTPRPDLVFLDWHLTETTAEDLLSTLETEYADIPVVVMTGSQTQEGLFDSSLEAADVVIEKPTDPDEYIDVIRSL